MQRWPEGAPPAPEWSALDGNSPHQGDLPRDYEQDEDPCLLEFIELDLELAHEQKDMLRTPEEWIEDIQFPRAFAGRIRRARTAARTSRWASKLSDQFPGKLQRKWQLP
eukprot:9315836-Pyramimonas_sp.AAC.1